MCAVNACTVYYVQDLHYMYNLMTMNMMLGDKEEEGES